MSPIRYEVLGKIAEGGLGTVYKAYDRNLRREVALKRVRASTPEETNQQAEQLFQEARTLSSLQHPHIVTIFDVGRDDEGAYIVMELLKGETLEDIIERGALNETDFGDLATQSLEGMISAHSTGLIHLDIKPQNFMVIWLPSGKFQIKILDFGLSLIAHQPLIQETDETGSILGSIFFMAPEQFERSPVDVRTDLYSLGCVFYFALTQNYPFQGETAPEVMSSHLYHSFIPLSQLRPDLPKFLPQWVEWLMHRDPDLRPSSAVEALDVFRQGEFPQTLVAIAVPDYVPPPDLGTPASALSSPSTSQLLKPGAPRRPKPQPTQHLGTKRIPKPLPKPINIAAAAAPQHLRPAGKPLPKWLTLGLPIAIASLALLSFAVFFFLQSQRNARFRALAAMEDPVGTSKDVSLLLRFLEDPANTKTAGIILGKLKNVEASNPSLINHLSKTKTPAAAENLATAIAERHLREATPALLRQLQTASLPAVRIALWNSLSRLASHSDVPNLIGQLQAASSDELRAAETAIVHAARTEIDSAKRSEPVLRAYLANTLPPDQQSSLIRILGRLGSADALPKILKTLKHNDPKLRTAAAIALGDWPTAVPVPDLLTFLSEETNPFIRGHAIASLGNLAPLAGDSPQEEIAAPLIAAHDASKDNREQIAILEALSRVISPTTKAFFEELAKQPRRKALANRALKTINDAQAKMVIVGADATVLPAAKAILSPGPLTVQAGSIINWFSARDDVNWLVRIDTPGSYQISLAQGSNASSPGRYLLTFGSERFSRNVERTGGDTSYRNITVGVVKLDKPGIYRLWLHPLQIPKGGILMRLREITLIPAGN